MSDRIALNVFKRNLIDLEMFKYNPPLTFSSSKVTVMDFRRANMAKFLKGPEGRTSPRRKWMVDSEIDRSKRFRTYGTYKCNSDNE